MHRNWVVAAILAVAAAARLWGIHFGLPYLNARPDEGAIVSIAGGMYNGDLNPHFFNYPALFMLAVAAGLYVVLVISKLPGWLSLRWWMDVADPTMPFRLARYLSAAAGIASVFLLFRIGRRLFGDAAGLAAAALLALAFLHARDSHFGVTDVPMTFLVLVAFTFIVRVYESPVTRDVIAAGAVSGLATATKYTAALIALPALLAIFFNNRGRTQLLRDRLRHTAMYGGLMVGAFLLASPFSVLDYREFLADVTFESRHLARGHAVNLGRGWTHHMVSSLRYGVGIPVLVAGILGMLLVIIRDGRKGVIVASFPLSYYLLMGSGYTVFARYMIPVVPFLCLTAAYAVIAAADWVAARTGRADWTPALVVASVVCLSWPSTQSVVRFNRLASSTDSRVLAREWLERHAPASTTIGQVGTEGGHALLFNHDRSEPKFIRADMRPGVRPDVVIVNSSPLSDRRPLNSRFARILSREYQRVFAMDVVAPDEPANVYDWQDDFFLPLTGFKGIERPGPNMAIYTRRGALPSLTRLPD